MAQSVTLVIALQMKILSNMKQIVTVQAHCPRPCIYVPNGDPVRQFMHFFTYRFMEYKVYFALTESIDIFSSSGFLFIIESIV